METVINAVNLGKKYKIKAYQGYLTFRDILANLMVLPIHLIRGKKLWQNVVKDEFWALQDISFEVHKGEVVGIIGQNGAGKSTLLKILSRITEPTVGKAIIRGMVGSLLEVGTGFHGELSGRENVFLNGAILGMKKKEIQKKFDQIVAFAEVEKYIDMPVKRYSSGMQVRLAFAVAAHLNPEILLIDEVLAVGDASFQKKCLGKMEEVTTQAGKTIIFVSHNLEAIRRLCHRAILLHQGKILTQGDSASVINFYLSQDTHLDAKRKFPIEQDKKIQITEIAILNSEQKYAARLPINAPFFIQLTYKVLQDLTNVFLSLSFYTENELLLVSAESDKLKTLKNFNAGEYQTTIEIPPFLFNTGQYSFNILIRTDIENLDYKHNVNFEILEDSASTLISGLKRNGKIATILDYTTVKI